jgi:TonB family protein
MATQNYNLKIAFSLLILSSAAVLASCNQAETSTESPERKEKPKETRKISAVSFVSYMARLHHRIKAHWLPKTDSGDSGSVSFTANKDGSITDLKILTSAGNKPFDEAMLATIKAALPFPPLPSGAPNSIPIEFTFNHYVFNHLSKGEPEEIKKSIDKLSADIDFKPTADLYFERAKLWLQADEKLKAIADLTAALAAGRNDVPTLTLKAQTESSIGNYKECIESCDAIIKIDDKNLEAFVLASDAHLNSGHLDQAFEAANRGIKAAPNHPDGYTARAYAYNLSFKYKKAIADCDTAIAIDPQCQAAYAYKGDAEEELKLYDQAMKDYNKNIELSPLDPSALLRRAELHNQMAQFHRAIIDCTDAIKLDPDNGEAYFYRSYANEQLSLSAQAKKDKDRAEALGFVGQ